MAVTVLDSLVASGRKVLDKLGVPNREKVNPLEGANLIPYASLNIAVRGSQVPGEAELFIQDLRLTNRPAEQRVGQESTAGYYVVQSADFLDSESAALVVGDTAEKQNILSMFDSTGQVLVISWPPNVDLKADIRAKIHAIEGAFRGSAIIADANGIEIFRIPKFGAAGALTPAQLLEQVDAQLDTYNQGRAPEQRITIPKYDSSPGQTAARPLDPEERLALLQEHKNFRPVTLSPKPVKP